MRRHRGRRPRGDASRASFSSAMRSPLPAGRRYRAAPALSRRGLKGDRGRRRGPLFSPPSLHVAHPPAGAGAGGRGRNHHRRAHRAPGDSAAPAHERRGREPARGGAERDHRGAARRGGGGGRVRGDRARGAALGGGDPPRAEGRAGPRQRELRRALAGRGDALPRRRERRGADRARAGALGGDPALVGQRARGGHLRRRAEPAAGIARALQRRRRAHRAPARHRRGGDVLVRPGRAGGRRLRAPAHRRHGAPARRSRGRAGADPLARSGRRAHGGVQPARGPLRRGRAQLPRRSPPGQGGRSRAQRLPRRPEPRAAHAAQRHPRLHPRARERGRRAPQRRGEGAPPRRHPERRAPEDAHRRRARSLGPGDRAAPPLAPPRRHARPRRSGGARGLGDRPRQAGAPRRDRRRGAVRLRRLAAGAADPHQPHRQRDQGDDAGLGHRADRGAQPLRGPGGARHRRRHLARGRGGDLPALPPGRRSPVPPGRRGARPLHRPAPGGHARGDHRRGERARRRLAVHGLPPARGRGRARARVADRLRALRPHLAIRAGLVARLRRARGHELRPGLPGPERSAAALPLAPTASQGARMNDAAGLFSRRVLARQMLMSLAAWLVLAAFAPKLLVLDWEVTLGVLSALAVLALIAFTASTVMSLIALRRQRGVIRAIGLGTNAVEPRDLGTLADLPSSLTFRWFSVSSLCAALQLVPGVRPAMLDDGRAVSLFILAITILSATAIPSYLLIRRATMDLLELAPLDQLTTLLETLELKQLPRQRFTWRVLLAVAAPVALMGTGAVLVTHAHLRTLTEQSRRATALLIARAALEAGPGTGTQDLAGRGDAIAAAAGYGFLARIDPVASESTEPTMIREADGQLVV